MAAFYKSKTEACKNLAKPEHLNAIIVIFSIWRSERFAKFNTYIGEYAKR